MSLLKIIGEFIGWGQPSNLGDFARIQREAKADKRLAAIRAGLRKADEEIAANGGKVPERKTPIPEPPPYISLTDGLLGAPGSGTGE